MPMPMELHFFKPSRAGTAGCLLFLAAETAGTAAMLPVHLRCEFRRTPLAVAVPNPRLTWRIQAVPRATFWTAYRILAASSPERLAPGKTDLWDSGKVDGDSPIGADYGGRSLPPGRRVFWQVRVWDAAGRPGPWSQTASWAWAPRRWQARWIGRPAPKRPTWQDLDLEVTLRVLARAAGVVFRAQDEQNAYMWQINTALRSTPLLRPHVRIQGQWRVLGEIPIPNRSAKSLAARPVHLRIRAKGDEITTWLDGTLLDRRRDDTFQAGAIGVRGAAGERALFERIRASTPAPGTGKAFLFDPAAGAGVRAVPPEALRDGALVQPAGVLLLGARAPRSDSLLLRREFRLDSGPVRRATAYVFGLGWYELWINGRKASKAVLAPANSPYDRLCWYDAWDVTGFLRPGANAVGIWLGNGYGPGYSRWGWRWLGSKRAVCELRIESAGARRRVIGTGPAWRMAPGPIRYCSIYNGEVFDARKFPVGWANPGFHAAGWQPARVLDPPPGKLEPDPGPPCRVTATLRPAALTHPAPGVWVYDIGQNMAGWPRIRVRGPAGTRVRLHTSELVNPAGMIDPWTNGSARATDVYILRGAGTVEEYEPRFTYHGFRYVEVRGWPGTPTLDDLDARVVQADAPQTGTFECDDPLLQRIHENCFWSLRSNLMSIPTDCSMRNERTPCQMDSQVAEEAAIYNFDMHSFYRRWLADIAAAGSTGNPDWSGDLVVLAWRLYFYYADRRILEKMFPAMKRYVDFLDARAPDHLWKKGYGDWCAPNRGTWQSYFREPAVVNTCLFHEDVRCLAAAARVLGKAGAAEHYETLANEIQAAFQSAFYHPDSHTYGEGTQSAMILPLALGLVPESCRQAVFSALVHRITGRDKSHLDTGIFATRYLVDVLADGGRIDLAAALLHQNTYPGFGFQIARGATTTWEQWTCRGPMNSHNHAMFAGIDASFYSRLAGLRPAAPGWRRILCRPSFPPRLQRVRASVGTPYGSAACAWQRRNGRLHITVTLPPGTRGEVWTPAPSPGAVAVSRPPGQRSTGAAARCLRTVHGCTVFAVASGATDFTMPDPQAIGDH